MADITNDGVPASDLEASIPLPTDHSRPATPSGRGVRAPVVISPQTVERLTSIAGAQGVSLPAALMAGLGILIERYTNQPDLVIGLVAAGRGALDALPIRVQLEDGDTVAAAIRRTGQMMQAAAAHPHLSADQAVRILRPGETAETGGALIQVALNVRSPVPGSMIDLAAESREPVGPSRFDLLLDVEPDPARPRAWLEADADQFSTETAARIARHVEAVLDGMAQEPAARAVRLPLIAEAERTQLLAAATSRPATPGGAATIHQRFAEIARRAPGAIALSCGDRRMSYAELEARSNQLAHRLCQLGAGPETRIGIHLDPSIEMVVAVLGVLKAGAAYLPIHGNWPAERTSFVLDDGGAAALITSAERAAGRPASSIPLVALDPAGTSLGSLPTDPPPDTAVSGSLAYVIYTSGSTGRPKGVLIPHDRVLRLFDATREFEFGPDDVWTLFHSVAFDVSVFEMWGALMHGGRLVIVPHLVSRSPDEFRRLLTTEAVTVLSQTPLAFRQLIPADAAFVGPLALRLVLFAGEALDRKTLRPWFERHGDARPRLVNLYGITETTVHNTIRWLTADVDGPDRASVGRPMSDLRMLILDRHGELAPIGVPGEIYVGGAGLARGYLGRPDLTAERFVPDGFSGVPGARLYRSGDAGRVRADGTIECLGRLDRQIKLRGHRIELEDIERTLRGLPAVADAAVVVEGDDPATQVIVAYLVARDGQVVEPTRLRARASRWLPAYMMPARIHLMQALPRTRNGKLDRAALRALRRRGLAQSVGEISDDTRRDGDGQLQ